ncbi:hypothetical protein B9Z19DRAFT_1070452 [Tuber borchii]|uniref:Uncharacterized protein n=1 Tax=Tuber borchii TaxID=42251 RepID=A0A2T7A910_TUBBO|nr:hypothetical protein B9Z19DRAFT_1070452 [Tuber borchii]
MGCGLHLPSRRRRCLRGESQRGGPGRSCCCSHRGGRCGSPGGKAGGGSSAVILRERGVVSIGGLVAVGRNGGPRPELRLGLETFRALVLYCIAYRIVWFKGRHQILTRLSARIPGRNSAARVYYRQKKKKIPRSSTENYITAQHKCPLPCHHQPARILILHPMMLLSSFFKGFAKTARCLRLNGAWRLKPALSKK